MSLLVFAGITSCETTDLDMLQDPTDVTIDQLDPDQLFNGIQLSFVEFVENVAGDASATAQLTRSFAATGGNQYANAFAPISFNGIWSSAYAGVLNDIQTLEPVAQEQGLTYQLGASKIMRAYVLVTLVDLFGDVPYSEALQGNDNLNPNRDSQTDVYLAALDELDQAISLLGVETAILPSDDLYFAQANGDVVDEDLQDNWITVAKTLKLRIFNNARKNGTALGINITSEVNSLLSENDLIDTPAEDWQFNYGTTRLNPNSRHPGYNTFYEVDPGGFYMSNYLMWTMFEEKGFDDPRLRAYFYRQDTDPSDEDVFTLGCQFQNAPGHYGSETSIYDSSVGMPFCVADPDKDRGFWGRDHLDNGGIPPDNAKRTVYGIYPVGGALDTEGEILIDQIQENGDIEEIELYAEENDGVQNEGVDGFEGAGITPILLSSYVNFIKAELALTGTAAGDARTLLEQGIRDSFDKVINNNKFVDFSEVLVEETDLDLSDDRETNDPTLENDFFNELTLGGFLGATSRVVYNSVTQMEEVLNYQDNYVNFVLDEFNASDNNGKLDILMKEYQIAAFGNGLEIYNAYRRTGFPSNYQPALDPNPGAYWRSFLYPANYINNNSNANQKERTEQIFWDTNPAGFIN